MNKKILSVILTAAMLVSLASCSGNNADTTTTTTAQSEAADTTTSAQTEETTSSEESKPEDTTTSASGEADSEVSCSSLTEMLAGVGELAECATAPMEDEEMLTSVMGYDLTLFDEISVVTHLISAHLIELTVGKPVEGKEEDAINMLNARKDKLINEVAFYPEQQENAEQTIVGSKNGYVYLLCFRDTKSLEEKLLSEIG